MKQNYLVAVIVATALFFTGCDKQENAPICRTGLKQNNLKNRNRKSRISLQSPKIWTKTIA